MHTIPLLRSRARKAARKGEWTTAVVYYRQLCKKRHHRVEDEIQFGHALKESGEANDALTVYVRAAENYPQNIDAQRQAGLFLKILGRNEEAACYFARGLVLDQNNKSFQQELQNINVSDDDLLDKYYLKGALAGNEKKQLPSLLKRIITNRFLFQARNYARQGNWIDAERAYRKILRHTPTRVNILIQMGHVLREQKKELEALHYYRYALLFTPRDPDIYIHIGHALKSLGRENSAFQAYLIASRLKPSFAAAAQELAKYKNNAVEKENVTSDIVYSIENITHPIKIVEVDRRQLVEEPWLDSRQKSIFKFLSGSLAYKE